MSALHDFGIVHGDLKLQNVLIFNRPKLIAKLADFSHSLFDTGESKFLVGGTERHAAPEWRSRIPTGDLLKTDIYSYGLLFCNLFVGFDILKRFEEQFQENVDGSSCTRELKSSGRASEYVENVIYNADMNNASLALDDLPMIHNVIVSTLCVHPSQRVIAKVLVNLISR